MISHQKLFTFMDLYNLSAKYAGLFRMHFTARETRTRECRSIKTKGAGLPNLSSPFSVKVLVKMQLRASKQQGQRRHPQSPAGNDVSMHSNIFFKALVLPDSKCQLPKHHLGKETIP